MRIVQLRVTEENLGVSACNVQYLSVLAGDENGIDDHEAWVEDVVIHAL